MKNKTIIKYPDKQNDQINQLNSFLDEDINDDENRFLKYTLNTTTKEVKQFKKSIDSIYTERKLLYEVIRNYIKKTNFLQLAIELSEDFISEEEYEKEIEEHPEKYIVNIQSMENIDDIYIISNIIKNIGVNYSIDEVTEMFALDMDKIDFNTLGV